MRVGTLDSVVSCLQNLASLVCEQHRCVVEADDSMETLDHICCKSRAVFRLWGVFWPVTTIISCKNVHQATSYHVSVQVEWRGESLITLTTGKFCATVAEGMLLQGSRVLETLSTRFTHALFRVRVRYRVSAQVALGEKGGWAEWAGEPFFIAFHAWVLELFVQSQVVLLSTGKATVLAYVRFLPTVSSTVYQKPRFLTKDLSTGGTGKSLDVCQVLVFVSQLV